MTLPIQIQESLATIVAHPGQPRSVIFYEKSEATAARHLCILKKHKLVEGRKEFTATEKGVQLIAELKV